MHEKSSNAQTSLQYQAVLIIAPILIGLALLRTFRVLSFTSILGDVAILAGAGTWSVM